MGGYPQNPQGNRPTPAGWTGSVADPKSPAGGNGPGSSQAYPRRDPDEGSWFWGAVHGAEHFAESAYHSAVTVVHDVEETAIRMAHVAEAIYLATNYASDAIRDKIRMDVEELKKAFIPGLVMALGILAITTLVGAGAGGILVGILTAGTGAVPAAVAGGELGLDAGLFILDEMGIGFLLRTVYDGISHVFNMVKSAMGLAWNAGTDPRRPPMADIDAAAYGLADAVAEMVSLLLEGVMIWLLAESAAARLGKLSKSLGKLGEPAALAARGSEVLAELRANSVEMRAALGEAVTELSGKLRRFGQFTRELADFVEAKIEQILKNVTEDAGKKAQELRRAGGGGETDGSVGVGERSGARGGGSKDTSGAPKRSWDYKPKQTGRVEPGAVPTTPELANEIKSASARTAPDAPSGWPEIPARDAQNFGSAPKPVQLPAGTKLYRVIGRDKDGAGPYWSTEPPPATESAWRSGYAVLDDWNGDGGYVEYTVPENSSLNAWAGPAAPQRIPVDGYALPGGQNQIWVPKGSIIPDGPALPTPWNK